MQPAFARSLKIEPNSYFRKLANAGALGFVSHHYQSRIFLHSSSLWSLVKRLLVDQLLTQYSKATEVGVQGS